ncbi:MAG: SufS family cysteine desulfurase, partial [Planctomycetota bacterium]
ADFPILTARLAGGKPLTYLDSGASAQKPRVVIEAVSDCYAGYYANVHRSKSSLGMRVTEAIEAAREKVRGLLNAERVEEVVFTPGTTASINLVADTWGRANVGAGDEIVVSLLEHHANLVPWQRLATDVGATLRFLELTADGEIDPAKIGDVVGPNTKLVAVTALSNVLGSVTPVAEIVAAARAVEAKVLLDAAQSVPHTPTDVRALDVDFCVFSGHKLYGPSGVGVLYGKYDLLEAMPPWQGGGNMIERVYDDRSTWAPPPAKFEAGTPAIAEIIGLGAAVDYVEGLGLEAIAAHEADLTRYAYEELSKVPGVTIHGPPGDRRGAMVAFTLEGAAAEDLNFLLDRAGIAVRHGHHCAMPLHDRLGVSASLRASFGLYNTRDDVDLLVKTLVAARKRLRLD